MNEQELDSRLSLADQFFALATEQTEAEMRTSISRLYYASFHVAAALTGRTSHGDIAKRLRDGYGNIGDDFKRYHRLRDEMDYDHEYFKRTGVKDIKDWYQERLREGAGLYLQLRSMAESVKGQDK